MAKVKLALAVVAGLFVIYLAAGPYITVHQMKTAAENQDGEALSEHIDFPSVRQSLKDQMNVMLATAMAEDEDLRGNPFAALGMAFAGVMVDSVVDAYVTPAGITQLMAGEPIQLEVGQGRRPVGGTAQEPLSDTSMSYASLNRFVVTVKDEEGGEGKFVLRRRGMGWKLTDIIIPLE